MHSDPRPDLSATVAPLALADEPLPVREALAWLSRLGYRGAQLSATDPATRPRDLGASARRDLGATLARHELACSGIDLFIPPAHFEDPSTVARAVEAVFAALGLSADLGRAPVVVSMPASPAPGVLSACVEEAQRLGGQMLLPVLGLDDMRALPASGAVGASVDCAAVLGSGGRPDELVAAGGVRIGCVRVVDLHRSGMRGPVLEPRESRLDVLALSAALSVAVPTGPAPRAVVDARQWADPRGGVERSIERWRSVMR